MGRDGADGLARLHAAGALTIAQDAASSAVSGMPTAAVDAGAVEHVVSVEELGATIAAFASDSHRRRRSLR
jgi:two-component system chemotaxis response regulator CheB